MRLRVTAGGLAPAVSAGWNVANIGAVATGLSHAYGVSLAVIGLFTTALFVTHAGSQVPAGRLCDRFGARVVGVSGLVVTGLASVAGSAWRDAAFAIGIRLVAGIGTGLSFVAGSDYIRTMIGSPAAQGLFGGVSVASGGAALAIVPQLTGWRAPFVSAAVVAGVGILVLAVAPATRERAPLATRIASSVFRDRTLLRLAAMHGASFGISVVVGNWVATLLERAGNDSKSVAGAAAALVLLLGIVTRPLGARVYGYAAALRASFLVLGAATILIAVAKPPALVFAATAIAGLATGIPFSSSFAGAARLRPDMPGAAVGYVNMLAAIVILVGTPLFGLTFSLPGNGRIGFVVAGALAATAALAVPRRMQ